MRSDCIIPNIKEKAIYLLVNTKLSCSKIGNKLGCSRGPIYTIYKELKSTGIKRNNIRISKKQIICYTCNKKFYDTISQIKRSKRRFCSKKCYTAWQKSKDNKGIKHPNWVDGGKHEDYLNHLRKSDDWKIWRSKIFQRDNYICQLCGDRGLELHPHHIKQKCDFPDLIFDINNGITLCKECHRSKGVHSYKSNIYKLFLEIVNNKNKCIDRGICERKLFRLC
jgi:hypothetical protein